MSAAGLLLSTAMSLVGVIVVTVLADMASAEIRGWLDRVPLALLRLVRRSLPAHLREAVHDEELEPELLHILAGAETRPASRLLVGIRFSLSLLRTARTLGRAREGHAPHTESLRRLISTTDACSVFGHLSTMAARLVLTFFVALTAGLGLTDLVGVGGDHHLEDIPLAVLLAAVFTLIIGGALALLMGPAIQETVQDRLHRQPPELWRTPELQPHHGWIVTASRTVLNWAVGEDGDKSGYTVLSALVGACAGVVLSIFAHATITGMSRILIALIITLGVLVAIRLALVEITLWWYRRQHRQLARQETNPPG